MPAARASERGAPIVAAFHHGLASLDGAVPIVGQLDADLTFEADYWQRLLEALEADERLGIVSGTCLELHDGRWEERFGTGASVWGAARLYRRECLDEVLPLEPRTGWDAIDVAVANTRGWETRVFRDVPFRHHRREGSREQSRWSSWAAQGRVSHFLGYRPSYLAIRAAFKAVRDPAALGLLGGYAGEALHRRPRCSRPGVVAWVRRSNAGARSGVGRGRRAAVRALPADRRRELSENQRSASRFGATLGGGELGMKRSKHSRAALVLFALVALLVTSGASYDVAAAPLAAGAPSRFVSAERLGRRLLHASCPVPELEPRVPARATR